MRVVAAQRPDNQEIWCRGCTLAYFLIEDRSWIDGEEEIRRVINGGGWDFMTTCVSGEECGNCNRIYASRQWKKVPALVAMKQAVS